MSCSGWPSLTRCHPCCYSLLPARIQAAKRKGSVVPDRTIFRQSAIAAYKRGMEKDVVPRLISWPIIVCFWLLPADQSAHLRVGLPVHVQIGSAGAYVQGTIAQVEPGISSPEAARKRYRLDAAGALLITQPSIVLIIRLATTLSATAYAGSLCTAKVETGS